jgi:RimJ/RimL family protein N-acetyltransferase
LAYYKTGGRIEPRFLGGRKADRAALWLVRLGADEPDGEVIGISSMIHRAYIPDQGWVILPQYQGRGYATEAAREVLRYFRDILGMQDLMAPTHQGNSDSFNIARKLGYVHREGGIMSEGGVLLDLQTLPGAPLPPEGFVLERWGRPRSS